MPLSATMPSTAEPGNRPHAEQRSPEYAYAMIKSKILDSEYAPGAQILEQEIAEQLGLSRTPVREALVRLQQEKLLKIVPRHGVRISTVSGADMGDIYEILEALESTAAESLARRRPGRAELSPLSEACDAMERALAGAVPDLKVWAAADEAFHRNLVELCGNQRLASLTMTVWEQAHRARMFTLTLRPLPVRSTMEHRAIVEAILAGDAPQAGALYRAHRRRGGEELMAIIQRHGLQRL